MPAIALILVPLAAVMIPLVLHAMSQSMQSWSRPHLYLMAGADQKQSRKRRWFEYLRPTVGLPALAGVVFGAAVKWLGKPVGLAIREAERYIQTAITRQLGGQLGVVARYLHGWAVLSHGIADYIADNAQQTYKALYHLRHVTLPRAIRAAVQPVQAELDDFERVVTGARVAIEQGLAGIGRDVVGGFDDAMGALVKAFDQIWKESYNAIFPKVNTLWDELRIDWNTRIRALEDDVFGIAQEGIDAIRKRLDLVFNEVETVILPRLAKLDERVGAIEGLFAGLVTLAGLEALLAKIAPELFCRNTREVAKRVCGFDPGLLDGLLTLLAAGLVVGNIRELTEELQSIERGIADEVRELAGI